MARYRGRVKVSKVDEKGNPIKGKLKTWIKKNPDATYYDSMLEWEAHMYFKELKMKIDEKPKLVLFDGIETTEFKKSIIKKTKQQSITFTPDYYIPEYDVYIEIKGYADPLFKLRWKLFKLKGYTGYLVYSIDELKELVKQLQNEDVG
jgi:hypothetical protein